MGVNSGKGEVGVITSQVIVIIGQVYVWRLASGEEGPRMPAVCNISVSIASYRKRHSLGSCSCLPASRRRRLAGVYCPRPALELRALGSPPAPAAGNPGGAAGARRRQRAPRGG